MIEKEQEVIADLITRMRKIEGQARGIQRMMEENRDCGAILVQLSAMKAAINRVAMKAVGCYYGKKMLEELTGGGDGRAAMEDIIDTLTRFS